MKQTSKPLISRMLGDSTDNICEARLRSNPRFRLISFDELDASQRKSFESLSEERDFYGLLVPPSESALPIKAVSLEAGLLLLRLREPARVPRLLANLFGVNAEAHVRQLILDGILEIDYEGSFLSGASAFQQTAGIVEEGSTYIAKLSRDAIKYGTKLQGLSALEIAARLYMFNRAPSTPSLQRRFAETEQVIAYLVGGSAIAKTLVSHWVGEVSRGAWLVWRTSESVSPLDFKLYISPTLDALPEAFRLTVDTLARTKCARFKVGLTAFGLLRPDKLVAYFTRLEDLQQAAELILASASGIAAHGVPFSAAIDSDGLVSWGMDPPRFQQLLCLQTPQSWRLWVAQRVAIYIVAAKEGAAEDITEFVLQRLAMDGVDTATWSPSLSIWRGLEGFTEEFA